MMRRRERLSNSRWTRTKVESLNDVAGSYERWNGDAREWDRWAELGREGGLKLGRILDMLDTTDMT